MIDLFFPVFKRLFIARGFAPYVFDEFEASIITLMQNTLPGEWLTGLINDSFNFFLAEKTNELAAFIGASSLSRAIFPTASDKTARSAQVVATAIIRGDELLRTQHQHKTCSAAAASFRLPHAPPTTAPSISLASPASPIATGNRNTAAAYGSTPGGGKVKQKGKQKNAQVAAPAVVSTSVLSPGRKVLPGSCTYLVKANTSETLLKIGRSDVFDAEQLVADVRMRSPGFNIDLKRDILLLAAWLAEGSEDQRARFVPPSCDRRFIVFPFSPFDKQSYITSKNF